MDISVRHLNSRMAVQVPMELPLGLVFVVGRVEHLRQADGDDGVVTFDLVEKGYRLRCRLSPRTTTNIALMENTRARAGGHLMFDPTTASYFLIARDVENMPASPRPAARSELSSILADVKKRADATRLTVSELPYWVKQMAPPEVRAEMGMSQVESDEYAHAIPTLSFSNAEALPPRIDQEMLTFLSKAMDSKEDIELTADILTRLAPDEPAPAPEPESAAPPPAAETPPPDHEASAASLPPSPVSPEELPPPQTAPRRSVVTELQPEIVQANNSRERLLLFVIVMLALTLFVVMLLLFLSL
ncbi:MAG: hypothetical protein KC418_20615 [Anaerolineales bacterium]|nr:hypothetical protein [Anaerolineales bacterium]MCB8951024.1 hypothetical protein [Ardenticatenales bacterium]